MDEVNIPGTLANTKVKFHHRKAGKEVKVGSRLILIQPKLYLRTGLLCLP